MLNKEKYAKEIVEITINGHNIAIKNRTNTLCYCSDLDCEDCYFSQDNYPYLQNEENTCEDKILHWANSEYREPKEFTEQERAVLRALDKIEWVVKDCVGRNWGFTTKPNKTMTSWRSHDGDFVNLSEISSCEFNSIKWEDTEPTSRAEILGGSEK